MKKNGFTLVEILAVFIILGILISLTVPAYAGIVVSVKRDNYNSKITEVELAASKYGEKIKDQIKDNRGNCYRVDISKLIREGYLISDSDSQDVINNPINNQPFSGYVRMCYCISLYDIKAYYVEDFDANKIYHKQEKVLYDNKIYITNFEYPGQSLGINARFHDDRRNKDYNYFQQISC